MSDSDERKAKLKIGISVGDVNGIGPEVIIKTFADPRMAKLVTPVIYGSTQLFNFYRTKLETEFNFFHVNNVNDAHQKKVNVVNVWKEDIDLKPGEANTDGGKYAILSLKAAVEDVLRGKLDAVVTAPINKDMMKAAGFDFPGHTEYLTEESGVKESLMLLVHEGLRVGVATGHIPVSEVSKKLTKEKIDQKLSILVESLRKDFGIIKPKIALLGLNPHAGENGQLGTEDKDTILPVIEKWKSKGHLIFGPFPADGFFGTKKYKNFDGVLGMYHDQGLIPFKTLAFDQGINFTAGLTFVRTSPDHGTGYDIAGTNQASPESFRQAVFLAIDVVKNRQEN